MRSSKQRSRSKPNRNRSVGNIVNRVFDSSGPEGKVRGTPQQIIDKYNQLTRDAQLSNDRVAAENFQQHAEHYTRMLGDALREAESQRDRSEGQQNGQNGHQSGQGGGQNGNDRGRDDTRQDRMRDDRSERSDRTAERDDQPRVAQDHDNVGRSRDDQAYRAARNDAPRGSSGDSAGRGSTRDDAARGSTRDDQPGALDDAAVSGAARPVMTFGGDDTAPQGSRPRRRGPRRDDATSDPLDLGGPSETESGLVDTPEGKGDQPQRVAAADAAGGAADGGTAAPATRKPRAVRKPRAPRAAKPADSGNGPDGGSDGGNDGGNGGGSDGDGASAPASASDRAAE